MIQMNNKVVLVFLLCPILSAAECNSEEGSCSLGQDATSLIQTQKVVASRGIERSAPRTRPQEEEADEKIRSGADAAIKGLIEAAQLPTAPVDGAHIFGEASSIVDTPIVGTPTLSGRAKCMATVSLALLALSQGVPGDFVETGVYQGGTSILMAKVLMKYDNNRNLWSADSCVGLPDENPQELARDKVAPPPEAGRVDNRVGFKGQYNAARETFEHNLELNGVGNSTNNPHIKVLQGWFSQTLPTAPIGQISFLRLDGDIYVSTMDSLTSLYSRVSPGGYIYVDDYGSYIGCKHAIDDFRQQHGITDTMYPIHEVPGTPQFDAVWWRKT